MEVNIISFKKAKRNTCSHNNILVDPELYQIECGDCGEVLDPIAYMISLCGKEQICEYRINRLREKEEEIKNRLRTKCNHCGKMTTI